MGDNILFICGKMMVGHDGLLSGSSVGGASLYQKTPSCPVFPLRWCTLNSNLPLFGHAANFEPGSTQISLIVIVAP